MMERINLAISRYQQRVSVTLQYQMTESNSEFAGTDLLFLFLLP